jgi:hypothetical protein
MDERRRSPRRRVLKSGCIVLNDGFSSISCTLRDLSDHGVRLSVASPIGIPPTFDLRFDERAIQCRVVRREAQCIGVEFARSQGAPSTNRP